MKGHDNISNIWPELAERMGVEVGSRLATWLLDETILTLTIPRDNVKKPDEKCR